MSAEENKAVVREMLAALDRSDWAAIEQHPGMAQTRRVHPMIHLSNFFRHQYDLLWDSCRTVDIQECCIEP
jgi:hypothetical protein